MISYVHGDVMPQAVRAAAWGIAEKLLGDYSNSSHYLAL